MKKIINVMLILSLAAVTLTACGKKDESSAKADESKPEPYVSLTQKQYSDKLLDEERQSIKVSPLSKTHEFYSEVVAYDPQCTEYIKEISIYDKEIDDTFIVHVSLPPEYKETEKYPMVVMTDGVWRLSDHPELRKLMTDGEIKPVILVSIGYPESYDYRKIRERDLMNDPESYLHFICDNLVPYLEEEYSVDKTDLTLTGHSLGGYWGFYALFNSDSISKNMFKNYYIGSPSFAASTKNKFIDDFEKMYSKRSKELNANVYVTVGSKEPAAFISPITNFIKTLEERNYKGLNLKYEEIKDYDHDTVFKPSIKNTMIMYYGNK